MTTHDIHAHLKSGYLASKLRLSSTRDLPHSAKESLVCKFRCSISECNKRFVTRPICNANVCATSGGVDVLNCYTRGGLRMRRVIICTRTRNYPSVCAHVIIYCFLACALGLVLWGSWKDKHLYFYYNTICLICQNPKIHVAARYITASCLREDMVFTDG